MSRPTARPGTARTRWLIGASIVGFWLVMTGLLLQRELGVRRLTAEPASRLEAPTETWMGIYVEPEQRIGQVHVRQSPEERRGLAGARMTLDAEMRLNLLGKSTDLELKGFVWRPYDQPEADFDFTIRSAEYDFRIHGGLGGGELTAEVVSAGETFPLSLPVDGEMVFASGFGATLELPTLEVGEEVRLESFDPLTLSKSPARVRCLARESLDLGMGPIATRRLQVTMGGVRSLAWVDEGGEVVRAETPFGLVLQKIDGPREAELAAPTGEGLEELLGRTAIRPSGQRPFRTARTMTVEIRGREAGPLDERPLPEDEVQVSLGENRYRLTVPPTPGAATAVEAPDAAYLAADTFAQADHPKIRRQASDIVAGETDPWRRARLIHDWVFTRIEKHPVVSIPSALEVLEKRRGDCNEHTVLFTALARAAGLPTRIAIGIVWSDELDGFYYHAWPEVHLDGRWLWMDPTLDQPLADATHLKLLNGGIESWPRLLPYLGQLEIEVLEVE